MAATGQPEGLARRKQYTSVSTADTGATGSWGTPQYYANWVLIEGAGTTVLTNEDGSTFTVVTDTVLPIQLFPGPFTGFTSTTATRVTMGNGIMPPAPTPPATVVAALAGALGGVALTGGLGGGGTAGSPILLVSSPNVTGVLPAANAQDFGDIATINLTSFTAAAASVNAFNFTAGSLTCFLPAITASLVGQALSFWNAGTGATTAKIAANGTAFISGFAGATAATITAPASGVAVRYYPSLSQNGWLQGL